MCGIFAYLGWRNPIPILLEGLSLLQYRGYDSAGLAVFHETGLHRFRCKGTIHDLRVAIGDFCPKGQVGIAHTRWATHGTPSELNAHPHMVSGVAIVHNGIIENHFELKSKLLDTGARFESETDTEVLCHLVAAELSIGRRFFDAVRESLRKVHGSYALAVMSDREPDVLVAARNDSPLVIGIGEKEFYISSDVTALLPFTNTVLFLEDGDVALLKRESIEIQNLAGSRVERSTRVIHDEFSPAECHGYAHFMLKEIYEQPFALKRTLSHYMPDRNDLIGLPDDCLEFFEQVEPKRLVCVACGTSYYACLEGKFVLEHTLKIPVEVDLASEFRYRPPLLDPQSLVILVSQSGETADTVGALREAKRQEAPTLGVCNVPGSTLARECDFVFYTHAGPEIGVASTKAFTSQLAAFVVLAVGWSAIRKALAPDRKREIARGLAEIPHLMEHTLKLDSRMRALSEQFSTAQNFLYLGRGPLYPIALEGALKLKEVSYVHAEGCPAGEIKHGPIALVDENMPVFILAQRDHLLPKVLNNLQEIHTRGGQILAVTDHSIESLSCPVVDQLKFPVTDWLLGAFLAVIPLQLFAYYMAVVRGLDVDKPRNLAKSVTVE